MPAPQAPATTRFIIMASAITTPSIGEENQRAVALPAKIAKSEPLSVPTAVSLPMMRHAFMLGVFYVFVQAMTSLSSVIFLVSAGNKLASQAIFSLAFTSNYSAASAMSVAMLLVVFAVMGAAGILPPTGEIFDMFLVVAKEFIREGYLDPDNTPEFAQLCPEEPSPEQAEAWGLIWRVVDDEALRDEAAALPR